MKSDLFTKSMSLTVVPVETLLHYSILDQAFALNEHILLHTIPLTSTGIYGFGVYLREKALCLNVENNNGEQELSFEHFFPNFYQNFCISKEIRITLLT